MTSGWLRVGMSRGRPVTGTYTRPGGQEFPVATRQMTWAGRVIASAPVRPAHLDGLVSLLSPEGTPRRERST
jgi:hypothetical protein